MREPTPQGVEEGRRHRFQGERNHPSCGPAGVMATACLHREIRRNTGDLRRRVRAQPEAREGQAGPAEESERSIVPLKPGNAGGGKGPWFKEQRPKWRQPGDWCEPSTSTQGWEATADVACQSEECTYVPLLRAVRQGVSSGCPGIRLPVLSSQPRRRGRGRPDVRGHRSVRADEVAG